MASRLSIFRIILALFTCAGFCELTWYQFSDAPEKTQREWVFQESENEGCHVFALSEESASGCSARPPVREALTISVYDLADTADSPPAPRFRFEGRADGFRAKAQSGLGSWMKSRGPPVV